MEAVDPEPVKVRPAGRAGMMVQLIELEGKLSAVYVCEFPNAHVLTACTSSLPVTV